MRTDPNQYSDEELEHMLNQMREVVSTFYRGAISTGCHPFIEFCGIMSKYIDLCRDAKVVGIQFPFANVHSGEGFRVQEHHAAYLAEKFSCIFAPLFAQDPKAWEVFKSAFEQEMASCRPKEKE